MCRTTQLAQQQLGMDIHIDNDMLDCTIHERRQKALRHQRNSADSTHGPMTEEPIVTAFVWLLDSRQV